LEIKRDRSDGDSGLTEDEEKDLTRKYQSASSYVALSEETLNLFGYISEGCSSLLVHESLVVRIAEMSNYFLNMLVGKKRKTLMVKGNGYHYNVAILIFVFSKFRSSISRTKNGILQIELLSDF